MKRHTYTFCRSVAVSAVRLSLDGKLERFVGGEKESKPNGRTIQYRANLNHPFFGELSSVMRKMVGLDQVIEKVLLELDGLELTFVTGDYASGRDSGLIDLVLVGEIDRSRLVHLIAKTETLIQRKIRTLIVSEMEYQKLKSRFTEEPVLLLWESRPVEVSP